MKTIGTPGDNFQLVVEALGDAVAFAESPHGHDWLQQAGQFLRHGP